MGCTYIYKDETGKPSAIYTRALAKYGPEKAEELYIRHMMSVIDTRYSAGNPNLGDSWKTRGAHLKNSDDHKTYIDPRTGYVYDSTTTLLQSYVEQEEDTNIVANAFSQKPVLKGLARGLDIQVRKMIELHLPYATRTSSEVDAAVDRAIKDDPELYKKVEAEILNLWEVQNDAGLYAHDILKEISLQWELDTEQWIKARTKEWTDANPGKDLSTAVIEDHLPMNQLMSVIQKVRKSREATWMNEDGFTERVSVAAFYNAVKPIYEKIEALGKLNDERYEFTPEVRVFTDTLKDPNSSSRGLAGTIDLILTGTKSKRKILVDFKTKAEHKASDFTKTYGKSIQGPFSPGLPYSSANMAFAQELIYAAIYRHDPNYNMHIDEVLSIVLPIRFDVQEGGKKLGENTYKIGTMLAAQIEPIRAVGNSLEQVKTYFTKGDLKKIYEDARDKGIAGITENWSGYTEDGTPIATFSKTHKTSYIRNKLMQKRTAPDGKEYIQLFNGERLETAGKTDAELSQTLGERYDEFQRDMIDLPNDIVGAFNAGLLTDTTGKGGRLPKTLYGRQNAIRTLLKDMDPADYTLELAQGWMQELNGIGPDVIVATHNRTGAITLLSAVTTMNIPVTFKSDESGDKRTTLVGRYATDKSLQSGLLSDDLMHKPRVHDFLAMKLGLAALYLNETFKDNLKIDGMRVVSMAKGGSTEYTETTIEEEISKLNAFRRHAGDDFPAEYTRLLGVAEDDKVIGTTADHMKHLMKMITNNSDPLGKGWTPEVKQNLLDKWTEYQHNKLVGWELRQALGNYLEALVGKLRNVMSDSKVKVDPRVIAVSKAFLELQDFQLVNLEYASERNSYAVLHGAVSSGDKFMIRFHVLAQEASGRTRHLMDDHFKIHKKLTKALLAKKNLEWVGNTAGAFDNMFVKSDDPELLMTLKDENDSTLSQEERNYIKYFNDMVEENLLRILPPKKHKDLLEGKIWKRGTVPIIRSRPELLTAKNFQSWGNLKDALAGKWSSLKKKTAGKEVETLFNFNYETQFDAQATDVGPGFSDTRRQALGIMDSNNPQAPWNNIERNLAAILNMMTLDSAEKVNNRIILQTVVAAKSMLAGENDPKRTGMTEDMIDVWREIRIFSRVKDEPISQITDPINRISSDMLFSFSLRQAMIELSTGTLQTASANMANILQNAYAKWFERPDMAGRFTPKDFYKALNARGRFEPRLEQIVWDHGMLVADADDMKNAEFYGGNKVDKFKSEAAFWMNRAFFNSSISNVFLAQIFHLGIDKAYVKKGDGWVYDETKDPRFFAYDPDNNIGTVAPVTDDEQKRFSHWKAVRESQANEGGLDPITKRMYVPMTSYERAEIKLYATRMVGSFSKDAQIIGDYYSAMRTISRYKKWAYQRLANYWTPTVRDEALYGHWEHQPKPEGGYVSVWVGDDFQGILQTLGHVAKEIFSGRAASMAGNLNQYQLENLTKLMSDALLWLLMMLLILPLLANVDEEVDEETGKIKRITGDWGKSVIGESAFKAATNAAADLMFLTSLGGLSSSMAPSFSVMGGIIGKGYQAVDAAIRGDIETAKDKLVQGATVTGPIRSIRSFTTIGDLFNGD